MQNPQLSAGEIYLTEWLGNDAVISAVKLDGAGKRALTHKPEAKPKEEPSPTPAVNEEEQNTDGAKVSERVLVASTTFFVAQPPIKSGAPTDSGNQAAAAGEGGNPHENLGIMGPHPDTGAAVEQPIPVADLSPAVSPDGKLVAFARRGQIWLVEADGTAQKQLTRFPTPKEPGMRVVSNPVWSPQGDCVLFLSFNDESGKLKLELWIAKTDPGSEHIVYSEIVDSEYGVYYSACTYPPVFTDGGKRIIFTSISSGEPRAATVGLDGADLRELVREASTFPSLDSSSKRLAYVSMQGSLERLCVLHLDSGKNSELFR
ncbi:MAG: hypothetical protein A2Z18_00270 [Armatimonadetes bacterium RBG_16_58_9]|nr:MAG: hypothetical protein A2Z18_00270 [Armatimonadetes bacterium RBG_16_58_9]